MYVADNERRQTIADFLISRHPHERLFYSSNLKYRHAQDAVEQTMNYES